jgi:hypothetical protein
MKRLMLTIIFSMFLLFLTVLPKAIAQAKGEPSKDDPHKKLLLETKCQKCHSMERIKDAHLTKEKAKEIVEKMRKKEGANISKDEATQIYEYLGEYFLVPPSPPVVPIPIR